MADNVCLADPPRRFGLIDRRAQRRRAAESWPGSAATTSTRGTRSRTCRCRAGSWSRSPRRWRCDPQLLILDEATSALTAADVERVFAAAARAAPRRAGAALHLAPHARDRRPGRHLLGVPQWPPRRDLRRTARAADAGDRPADDRPRHHPGLPAQAGAASRAPAPCLEVAGLGWGDRLADLSLPGRQGRDRGAGRARRPGPARADAGAVRRAARRRGHHPARPARPTPPTGPAQAKSPACGMALVPEDRKTEGLLLPMAIRDNLSLAALDALGRLGIVDAGAEGRAVEEMIRRLHDQARRPGRCRGHAVRRQPAEGGDRQVAADPAAADPAQRPDPRHRCRHQAGALRA